MTAFLADEYKDYKNPFYDETKESKLDVDNLIFENTELCNNKSRVAYDKGLDLYAMIAQSAYNNDYWDNMEHYKEGTEIEIDGKKVICGHKTHINVQGKTRRKTGKVLNLASTYGMGGKAAGEKLGFEGPSAAEEGEKLLDNFFRGFPAIYVAIDESKKKLQRDGFVSGLLGRRRHLPWVNDPDYEVKPMDASSIYNPFLNCNKPKPKSSAEIFWEEVIKMYVNKSKSKDGLKNNEYEHLAKLAANPYLWDKPCADKAQIESLIKRKAKVKDIAQYVKHSYTRRQAVDNATLETFEYTAYSLEKDEQGELKIMTNREKLLADIDEYNHISVALYDAPEVNLSLSTVFPKEPVLIQANTGRKAQAMRQCFNARIQGSAATLTKLAMIDIANDEKMKQMDAKLIIPVHDELLMECPAFYADEVAVRLPELMCGAALKANDPIPQACDPDVCDRWYSNEMAAHLLDDYNELINGNQKKKIAPIPPAEAMQKIIEEYSEFPAEAVRHSIETGEELVFD